MKKDTIPINKSMIPYHFNITLGSTLFRLSVRYNSTADLFTIGLYKEDELICTEPVIYGSYLFEQLYQPNSYPALSIVPLDSSGENDVVTWDNFGETVFLVVDNAGSDEAESETYEFVQIDTSGWDGGINDDILNNMLEKRLDGES